MRVIIDTNMFLAPEKFRVDIFGQLKNLGYTEFYTLSRVLDELKNLSQKRGKTSKAAKIGLILIEKYSIKILPSAGHVDKSLIELSRNYSICTQDKKLIKTIYSSGKRAIYLKQKKYLVEDF